MFNAITEILTTFVLPFMLIYILIYLALYRLNGLTKKQKKTIALSLSFITIGTNILFSNQLIMIINGMIAFVFIFFLLMLILQLFEARFNPKTKLGKLIVLIILISGLQLMLNPFFGQKISEIVVIVFTIVSLTIFFIEIITKK